LGEEALGFITLAFLLPMLLQPAVVPRAEKDTSGLETQHCRFVVNFEGAARSLSLVQTDEGRGLLASDSPLFSIVLREGEKSPVLTAKDATTADVGQAGDEMIIRWTMSPELGIRVETRFRRNEDASGIAAAIRIENRGKGVLRSVSFPVLSCKLPLDQSDPDACVVFPRHEGVILQRPHVHLDEVGRWETEKYPGHAAFQFMGYYDRRGGVYLGAHDPDGYPKEFRVRRGETGLELSIVHLGMTPENGTWKQPYPAVIDAFTGDWMAAADVYRDWTRDQRWCSRRITERNVPAWLRDGVAFFNYPAEAKSRSGAAMPLYPPETAAAVLRELGETLGVSVVATPFSWEKNGTWIGPDYFPPRGGADGYRYLANSLHHQGNRLFVFLSGFRWGLTKPGTDFDGRQEFERQGLEMALRDASGAVVYDNRPWAENALLCVGSKEAQDLLARCFERAFDLGMDMAQLDQNVGGEAPVCYAANHDHPPGPGRWQAEAMATFLKRIHDTAKKSNSGRAVSIEEPCELFIPYLDVYHGRAFTYTGWPASGKGAVSAPVFIYLYHPYLLGYAGWAGGGFDLENNVELSIGRAFVYGMLIGVRSSVWMRTLEKNGSKSAFEMWRRAALLQRMAPDAHLRGDMARPPRLRGVTTRTVHVRAGHATQPPTEVKIDNVQAATWILDPDQACYALANVEPSAATVEIEIAPPNLARRDTLAVTALRAGKEPRSVGTLRPGDWLPLELAPCEILYLTVSGKM